MTSNDANANSEVCEKEETRLLFLAARKGLTNQLKVFLEYGADVNAQNEAGETPLHAAVVGYLSDCTKELLRHGANVCAVNDDGDTPLHLAARIGALDCVRDLSTYGSNVNARNKNGKTALHEAAEFGSFDCMTVLLEYGADVNAQDDSGDTPLHEVARFSLLDCIKVLLAHGADVNIENEKGETALHIGVQKSSANCVKVLLMHEAVVNGENNEGETPLHLAADNELPDYIEMLLEHGADVNDRNGRGNTALHIAVQKSGTECILVLLANGADIDAQNEDGETPLHEALLWGMSSNAQLLLDRGADINARDVEGDYPIHAAVMATSAEDVRANINLLLKHGADLESRNLFGQTPAHNLSFKARSALIDNQAELKEILKSITVLFSFEIDLNAKDVDGYTPYTCIMSAGTEGANVSEWFRESVLAYHVRKLIALRVARVAEKNRPLFFAIMKLYVENTARLLQEPETKSAGTEGDDYHTKCVAEVEKLMSIRVFKNVMMGDMLTLGNSLILAKISGNVRLCNFVKSAHLGIHFPIYSFLIRLQHQRGLALRTLYRNCVTSLETLSSGKLNEDLAYEILQYLSVIELQNLNQAGRETS